MNDWAESLHPPSDHDRMLRALQDQYERMAIMKKTIERMEIVLALVGAGVLTLLFR